MSVDLTRAVVQGMGRAIRQEHKNGNTNTAGGLTLLVIGFFLLPIPIVGLPMMIWGIIKLCKGDD
jgi:hypothetical protein